jgi:hypothetical protein
VTITDDNSQGGDNGVLTDSFVVSITMLIYNSPPVWDDGIEDFSIEIGEEFSITLPTISDVDDDDEHYIYISSLVGTFASLDENGENLIGDGS